MAPLSGREPGIVVARTADRLIAVLFDTGRVEHVHPAALRFEEPPPGET